MLVSEPKALEGDPISNILANILGKWGITREIQTGIYLMDTWPSSNFLPEWEMCEYGVADTVEQVLEHHPELEHDLKEYLVVLVEVRREEEPETGGWRYHKWGPYIGTQNPQHEYLYDDKHIDSVLTFEIYERVR